MDWRFGLRYNATMKQVIVLKLEPSPEPHAALLATLEAFNAGCQHVADMAYERRLANKIALQPLVYGTLRERFGLSSQMAVRAISKAASAYKRDKRVHVRFKPHGAMVYDERIMSFKGLTHVSLLTIGGRQLIPIRKGSRERATVRKSQRYERMSWAFHQLRQFIAYKAAAAGIPLILVDPRNTSRTCPQCGHCAKENRRSQSEFLCEQCGFAAHADYVGATNVCRRGREARAAVSRPKVSDVALFPGACRRPGAMPPALAAG